jgi:hypothetical protein
MRTCVRRTCEIIKAKEGDRALKTAFKVYGLWEEHTQSSSYPLRGKMGIDSHIPSAVISCANV